MDILQMIKCALIEFFNMIIDHILNNALSIIEFLIGLLPSLPLPTPSLIWGEFGVMIGYFVPVGSLVKHFTLMLSLVSVYYAYEYIMRWIKMIK